MECLGTDFENKSAEPQTTLKQSPNHPVNKNTSDTNNTLSDIKLKLILLISNC